MKRSIPVPHRAHPVGEHYRPASFLLRVGLATSTPGHPIALAVFGLLLCVGAAFSMNAEANSLLVQILLGASSSFAIVLFLIARARQSGTVVSVLAYSIFFLNLFYTMRGATYLLVGDSDLAVRLGISNVSEQLAVAMTWFNLFLGLFCLGAFFERRLRIRSPKLPLAVLQTGVVSIQMGFVVLLVGCVFLGLNLVAIRYISVIGYFVIAVPLGFGVCLAGFARWVTPEQKVGVVWRYAIAFAMVLLLTYFMRGHFTARMYSIGILALFGGFLVAHLRLNLLAMLGLVLVLPVIQSVGETRYVDVSRVGSAVMSNTQAKIEQGPLMFLAEPYTADSGDFTALDIFAAALANGQFSRPWGMSFLYMFVHWVPRNFWPSKPVEGFLTDEQSFRLAHIEFSGGSIMIPYDPGIVGTLYLEGAGYFVALGALVLGFVISRWDRRIGETMRHDQSRIHACAMFSMAIYILFFTARFRPYQIFYLVVSLFVGYYIGLWLVRYLAKRLGQS